MSGADLNASDYARIGKARPAVLLAMIGGQWHTLAEVSARTGIPEASVSARLRDLRKAKYGAHRVECRRRFGDKYGTREYRLELNDGGIVEAINGR